MNDEQPESSEGPTTSLDEDLLAQAREAAAGHPGLEDALRRLEALDEVDLDQHPAEFDAIHRALRAALTDAGEAPAGVPGPGRQDSTPAGVPGPGRQDPMES
jgi:hypothetical protein